MDKWDGKLGEGFSGEAPNTSHINLALASRGTPTYAAVVGALANQSSTHMPFLVCLGAGNMVRPATIVINKVAITGENYGRIIWGAGQLGIGDAVLEAVERGELPKQGIDDYALLVALWVNPDADDAKKVRGATKEAMAAAIHRAVSGTTTEDLTRMLSLRDTASNDFFSSGK